MQAEELLSGGFPEYFPNGYPLIIIAAEIYKLVISHSAALILINIILSTASVWIIYLSAQKLLNSDKYAFAAALIAAFYPNQLNYVRYVLTEVPAAFFLIISLYFLVNQKPAAAGISIGIASAIKTILLPAGIIFCLYLIWKKEYKEGITFIVFSIIPLMLLLLYGYFVNGRITLPRSAVHNFYITLGVESESYSLKEGVKLYYNFFLEHPGEFIMQRLKSLWDLWGFLPGINEGFRSNIVLRLLIGLRFILLAGGIYGFAKMKKKETVIYLTLPAVIVTIIHTILYSSPRYTFTSEPFLILLFIAGVYKLSECKGEDLTAAD
jgi:4-amino-4-deoxy-L-arabinose transferase-like glycosyltransferase